MLCEGWSHYWEKRWSNYEFWEGKLIELISMCRSHSFVYGFLKFEGLTGSFNWSICHDIHGWVCNASKSEVWSLQAKQVGAWFVKYRFCKSRNFCCFVGIMGTERWTKSSILRWEGWAHHISKFLAVFYFYMSYCINVFVIRASELMTGT